MTNKIYFVLLLAAFIAIKDTHAQGDGSGGLLGSILGIVPGLLEGIANGLGTKPPVVKPCGVLKNGKQYYLKSPDGRFAVYDATKQLAFLRQVPATGASRFTAVEKGCNIYGLCVDGFCMSRCQQCTSDTGDFQTAKFHINNSDSPWSQWTLTSGNGSVGGPYALKADSYHGYLTFKRTRNGEDQLTVSATINNQSGFQFVEVEDCEILKDGKQYYIRSADGRFAVLDANKQLAFAKTIPTTGASRFTAFKKSCNVYGLCVGSFCMSRCEGCSSDVGDYQTARFHLSDSNSPWSQWTITAPKSGGPYNLQADNLNYLSLKRASSGADQLTLSTVLSNQSKFTFVEVEDCGILEDGKQYNIKSKDGRYAVFDESKNLAFFKDVPSTDASRFTAYQKSCNVYGLCIGSFCMSRCEACSSDVGDYETATFHMRDSSNPWSQWELSSSIFGGPYNLRADNLDYLTYKATPNAEDQLTLTGLATNEPQFTFEKVEPDCGILEDGKQYYIQSKDGRYAVFDETKNIAFFRDVPSTGASRFTAYQKSCNVYGLCIGSFCMSRCEACSSDVGDYQTATFHMRDSSNSWSQWELSSSIFGGPYNLRADNLDYLTYKATPNAEDQLTLTGLATNEPQFTFEKVEPDCGILEDGKQYYIQSKDGRYAVFDESKNIAFFRDVPSTGASRFTAYQKNCNVYGLCIGSFCMSRCEACSSDVGDYQTATFHMRDSSNSWSQWELSSSIFGGPYNLRADNLDYLTYKATPNAEDQLTLTGLATNEPQFTFEKVEPDCGILEDGKQYYIQSKDGRYAVFDESKNIAFFRDVPSTGASRFTAYQKSCNVYGLCIGSFCMSRCEACSSDVGDYQTATFHMRDSSNPWSQWELSSSIFGGPYNLRADNLDYLTYKATPNAEDQLTLTGLATNEPQFTFEKVEPDCGILEDGKQYYIESKDGRYAVFDESKNIAFFRDVPSTGASRFTAYQKNCNVYGLCIGTFCMSRCEACSSDVGDYQTATFHMRDSSNSWSQWELSSSIFGGPYNLRADNLDYLTYKATPNAEDQLTLTGLATNEPQFTFEKVEPDCGILEDGKQYYIQSKDGRYAVFDESKNIAFFRDVPSTGASRFTAYQKNCNVYGLCIGSFCMSRCEACSSDVGDYQTATFHMLDSSNSWSQWELSSSIFGGPYNLRADNLDYLTYKATPNAEDQLTLTGLATNEPQFTFEKVEPDCGILEDGKQYYIQSKDGRYAVFDESKNIAFFRDVPSTGASRFTAYQKNCNVYGLCIGSFCMSRCEACSSDVGDYQTATFHMRDSSNSWSQWELSSSIFGGPYNLRADNLDYLTYKATPNAEDQLTLTGLATNEPQFTFEKVEPDCGILEDGKQYYIQSNDGRYAVFDESKNIAFFRDVPSTGASRFTAYQKSCNVYGLCIGSFCMSRCEACSSDVGDYQTATFHMRDSTNSWSQWELSSSIFGGPYNLRADNLDYLTYKATPNAEDQLTLTGLPTNQPLFTFVEAPNCGILEDGKEYHLKSADGRFAVVDANKQLAFLENVPSFQASKFTAVEKGCNVYGLCVNGFCMSRCEGCESDTSDDETAKFHVSNSDAPYSQWTVSSLNGDAPYNLKIDDPFGFLTSKLTPNGDDQLTLSTDLSNVSSFDLVDVDEDCGILKNGKEYYLKTVDGRFAVLDVNKQLAFMEGVDESSASKFVAVQKTCDLYGLCVDGHCMSRCEGCYSETMDYQTVRFHAVNADFSYSQWSLTSSLSSGTYNLQSADPYGSLFYKQTSAGAYQLTLSTVVNDQSVFQVVEVL